MRINCVSCGHQIEVDDDSYAHYSGPLRCWVCHAVLVVRIVDGRVDSASLPGVAWDSPAPAGHAALQTASPKRKAVARTLAKEASHD